MTCFTDQPNGTEILLDYCSDTLAADKAAAVTAHARACAECQSLIDAQRQVFEALDAFEAPEVSANFDQRLFARIAQDAAQPTWKRWVSLNFDWIVGGSIGGSSVGALWKPALAAGLAAAVLTVALIVPSHNQAPNEDQGKQTRIERHSERIDMDQVERGLEDLDLLAPRPASGTM